MTSPSRPATLLPFWLHSPPSGTVHGQLTTHSTAG